MHTRMADSSADHENLNKMTYTLLSDVAPARADQRICVRVSRLWHHRAGVQHGPVNQIHMALLDRQANHMHAVVERRNIPKFGHILQEGNIYEISQFLVVPHRPILRPVEAAYMIIVTRSALVWAIDLKVDDFPRWCYTLTPIASLPRADQTPQHFVDVIGTICAISDVTTLKLPDRFVPILKRDVFIMDLRSLQTFEPIAHAMPTPSVVLRPQPSDQYPRRTVLELLNFNLFENTHATFQCMVQINKIIYGQQWWQTSCAVCRRRARPATESFMQPDVYTCETASCSSTKAHVIYRICLLNSDCTGEARFTLLGRIAEQIVGMLILQVIRNNQSKQNAATNLHIAASQMPNPPPELAAIVSKRYRFRVKVS